jgi:fluoroacetyl-CoA thioesterase
VTEHATVKSENEAIAVKPGLTGEATLVVKERHTAQHLRRGAVYLSATPVMVALMEEAARNVFGPPLEPGQVSVGTALAVKHQAATPIEMRAAARAELLTVDERMLTFGVKAQDVREMVGEGTHIRAIVNREKFLSRAETKAVGHR